MSARGKRAVSVAALGTVDLPARQAEVYEFVRAHPYHTALELENMSGYRRIGCRLAELERAGLLRVLDPRPDQHTGRNAHVWAAECDPRMAQPRKPRETARELRRRLDSYKEEVRYLAARLTEMTAQRDALHAQLQTHGVHHSWVDARHKVAAAQRDACAKAVLADYAAGELTPAAVTRACRIIQQTPLVTEGEL